MINVEWARRELKRTLSLLAAPAEAQIAHLKKVGGSNDELGLEFDGVVGAAPELEMIGLLNSDQMKAIRAVEDQLTSMSGLANAALWEDDGIRADSRWERVRELAKHALRMVEGSL